MENNELLELRGMVGTIAIENAELKKRIAVLEKNNRQRVYARLGFVLAACILAFAWFQLKHTFSGRWIEVHDRDAHISAWLDDTGLQFKDKQGRVRAKLGLFPEGSPFLQMFSEAGTMKAQLFIYPPDDAGYLMLWGKDGKGMRYPASTLENEK